MSFPRISLKDKLTILIAGIIFICIALVSYDSYLKAKTTLIDNLRGDLKNMAQSLSISVSPREVETVLAGNDKSPAYWALKQKLNGFTKLADGKINTAYVMIPSPKKDTWLFVADNELKDESKISGFREEYDVTNFAEMKKSILIPAADTEITGDKWGRWLSGYAPIFDENNRPFAIIGLDMKASDVEALQGQVVKTALLYFSLGLLLAVILGRIGAQTVISPLQALLGGVRELRTRNYGSRIEIKRNDEIGDLITAFNEMSDKLNEVDKIKGDFLSVISHELYTPLTPILGGAETLLAVGNLPDELKQIVVGIERQAKKMQDMVDDVLDFSWLDLKDLKLKRVPVDIKLVTEEVVTRLQPAVQAKSLVLDVKYQPQLPTIVADQKRLAHVINILLGNAVKFTPEKGRISLSVEKTDDSVKVTLTDTGIGIAKENLTRMFERFYQVEDHLTRTKGGLGLGLAIAKRIIEAHGGKIWAESPGPGQGATVSFTLPIFV